mmetsp:Transcript_11428/g.35283  ORF Transcript_11428/g.35283 Transcript_11428/m.35283 type:complete len:224 (-) Transcript_11428:1136-1807(-)
MSEFSSTSWCAVATASAGEGVPELPAAAAAIAVPSMPQPKPVAADAHRPAAHWHLSRRRAILQQYPQVERLQTRDARTLPALVAVNAAQVGASVAAGTSNLPNELLVPLGLLVGGTLSLWQFALLHDVKHGTALLPRSIKRDDVLFAGAIPSLFGYYLYLRYGHLNHHADFGSSSLATLFNSEREDFEDGRIERHQPLSQRPAPPNPLSRGPVVSPCTHTHCR